MNLGLPIATMMTLLLLLSSCGNPHDHMAEKQVDRYFLIAKDEKKNIDLRLLNFIQLQNKAHYQKTELKEEIKDFISNNKTFFHKHLFKALLNQHAKNVNEEDIFNLSSYDYEVNESIKLKKELTVYTYLPKDTNTLEAIKEQESLLDASRQTIEKESELKIIEKTERLQTIWVKILDSNQKFYYLPAHHLIKNSNLTNSLKAKAIWLCDFYVKNYDLEESFEVFTFLIREYQINVNRTFQAKYSYLHKAVQRGNTPQHFAKYLIDQGAQKNAATENRQTALDLAENNNNMIDYAKHLTIKSIKLQKIKEEAKKLEIAEDNLSKQIKKKAALISYLKDAGCLAYPEAINAKNK